MQELQKSNNQYMVIKDNYLITIKASDGCEKESVSLKKVYFDSIARQLIIAVKLNRPSGIYDTDYIFFDSDMNVADVLAESEGVNPNLFSAPDKSVWVELCSTKPNKSGAIILSLKQRERIKNEIFLKSLSIEHQINCNGETFQFYTDIFNDKKPDKMHRLIFDKKGLFGKRKSYTIPLPQKCTPVFSDNMIQLANNMYAEKTVLHREMDFAGEIRRQREISLGIDYHFALPVSLSFNDISTFFVADKNEVFSVMVDENAHITEINSLFKVEGCEDFYNIFNPCVLKTNAYIIRFTYEKGNEPGYMVIRDNKMSECWTRPNGSTVYKDQVSGKSFDIESSSLILNDVLMISNTEYALFFAAINSDGREIKILVKSI